MTLPVRSCGEAIDEKELDIADSNMALMDSKRPAVPDPTPPFVKSDIKARYVKLRVTFE